MLVVVPEDASALPSKHIAPMLPRSQRLSGEQLDSVMEKGRVAHSSLFLVRFLIGQTNTRIAVIASKKIAKTATVRNAIRRSTYRAIGSTLSKIIQGTHVALFAKKVVSQIPRAEIETDLENLFVKAKIVR